MTAESNRLGIERRPADEAEPRSDADANVSVLPSTLALAASRSDTDGRPIAASTPRSFQLLAIAASALLLAAAILVVVDRRDEAREAAARSHAAEVQMHSQRIGAHAPRAAAGEANAAAILQGSMQGIATALASLAAATDAAASKTTIAALNARWQAMEPRIRTLLAERPALSPHGESVQAAATARELVDAADGLFDDAGQLVRRLQRSQEPSFHIWAAFVAAGAAFACLLGIGKVALDDAERRARASQQNAMRTRQANERTQLAILRLLDEISTLAQGDLTVRASVNDETTGAIADAVNFAVGELRRLVTDINQTATRFAEACAEAQTLSGELLNASQRQAQRIGESSATIGAVTASVQHVAHRAQEAAGVAGASLAAAAEGTSAVKRAVTGIEAIRGQIQETAKRIKRLGESSQEIGEIVDLVADITRRTEVLAVNAAIQANAGGGAGRGPGNVAEEVQRLAARSAQAMQQIDEVVRIIQADTQDATQAMERSTEAVVEHTRLVYAAGDALGRIDRVSRELAQLIAAISHATQAQREAAGRIRAAMADILRVTELTSEGTRRSADRSAQLAEAARRLQRSVAGFKLSRP